MLRTGWTGGRGGNCSCDADMWGWVSVAAGIAALDIGLVRSGRPTLSNVCWGMIDDPKTRPLPLAVWAGVSYHLLRPRRPWLEAEASGALFGFGVAVVTRLLDRTVEQAHIP